MAEYLKDFLPKDPSLAQQAINTVRCMAGLVATGGIFSIPYFIIRRYEFKGGAEEAKFPKIISQNTNKTNT